MISNDNFVILQRFYFEHIQITNRYIMELSKVYNPKEVEEKWYQYWVDHKLFRL